MGRSAQRASRPRCSRPIRATSNSTTRRSTIAQAKDRIPVGSLHRRQDLQFLAGRGPRPRDLAAHEPRELLERQSAMGDGARSRRACRSGEGELGVEGCAMRPPRRAPLPDQPLRRRRGCGHDPRVRPSDQVSSSKSGFVLPKGKQRVDWEDENTLLVCARMEAGRAWPDRLSLSSSSACKRGQPLVGRGRGLPRQAPRTAATA